MGVTLINARKNPWSPAISDSPVHGVCFSVHTQKNTLFPEWEGGRLPYKKLMGMCCWMGSRFHDWIDYNGVAFSIELLEWGHTFSDFVG